MAIFDAAKTYLDNKTIFETIAGKAVDFSNLADVLGARAGWVVEKVGTKTSADLQALGIPKVIADDVIKVAAAAKNISIVIAAEVAAGNIRNGQFNLGLTS